MIRVNPHFSRINPVYLFAQIRQKVEAFKQERPDVELIHMGIGDVSLPLVPAVVDAMREACEEMGSKSSFRGYGPEQGYDFLREAIIRGEYEPLGIRLHPSEVFVSDGSKCDVGNIQELFATDCTIALGDPVYPVYLDSNLMAGRTNIRYLPFIAENGFNPAPPEDRVDVVYLCSPNNPTGMGLDRASLQAWVDYAHKWGSIILFDAAYSAYIRDENVPKSIYEIPGAREVAIEFKSFSKTAGFTGLRCAFTVVPHELKGLGPDGEEVSLNALWNRRQCTKFNGVSYPVQRAAEAVYSEEGSRQVQEQIDYYKDNARMMVEGLREAGFSVYGGQNAPYVWLKLPEGTKSFDFFDTLLNEYGIVGTPGIGFGSCGEGYFRLSSFGARESLAEGIRRLREGGLAPCNKDLL